MDDKHIAKLAKKIAKLEKTLDYASNVEETEVKIQQLIGGLTPDQIIEIDDYIISHHLMN